MACCELFKPCKKIKITRDFKYRYWIREQPCLACYHKPTVAHHHRTAENSGTGIKPDDKYCIPLCHQHHAELHHTGVKTFAVKYGIDFNREIKRLRSEYHD